MNKQGPFEPGETVDIIQDTAKILINKGFANRVNGGDNMEITLEKQGNLPVLKGFNNNQAAWINKDKNDNKYLSVKTGNETEDGEPEYVNLYIPDEDGEIPYSQE